MKKRILESLFALTLIACSSTIQPTPVATATPTLAITITATSSPLPPTETHAGQPVSEWKGIPIIPGAIAGEGDDEGYVFTIKATPQQVQEYYQLELGKRGWQLFSQETSGASLMLNFMDTASATLTVNILSKGEEVLVLLVK